MEIKAPRRVMHSYVQQLVAPPEEVFPLLCPVREADWIDGWDPLLVISLSGVAEPDCVFVTEGEPHDAIWYISRHEPDNHYLEMLKISPEVTACRLTIQLAAKKQGSTATITYTHTSLGPEGDMFIDNFTEDLYTHFMQDWETRLNNHLQSNKKRM